jgi:hypothetical protein
VSVVAPCVPFHSIVLLNVVMISVVILNVVAPLERLRREITQFAFQGAH